MQSRPRTREVGNPHYLAPEMVDDEHDEPDSKQRYGALANGQNGYGAIIRGNKQTTYDEKVDIYMFGCVALELTMGVSLASFLESERKKVLRFEAPASIQ